MAVPLVSTALKMTYKSKGKTSPAIKNFSFSVKDNSIFSILGRNGSGKTTFVKISTTQLRPDSGSVEIFGHDVIEEDQEVRKIISLVPQESRPFPFLTPWEHVYYFQKMNVPVEFTANAFWGFFSPAAERIDARWKMSVMPFSLIMLRTESAFVTSRMLNSASSEFLAAGSFTSVIRILDFPNRFTRIDTSSLPI